MSLPALAIGCFAVAQSLHGSGYIAAFVGGLVFRGMIGDKVHHLVEPAEGIGEVLALVAWVMFGLLIVPLALPVIDVNIVLYAVLSLTLIRMLPIAISLIGSQERTANKLFLWLVRATRARESRICFNRCDRTIASHRIDRGGGCLHGGDKPCGSRHLCQTSLGETCRQ